MIETRRTVMTWNGHAVAAHCGNTADGLANTRVMGSFLRTLSLSREDVEAMLPCTVIPRSGARGRGTARAARPGEAAPRGQSGSALAGRADPTPGPLIGNPGRLERGGLMAVLGVGILYTALKQRRWAVSFLLDWKIIAY
jgi:hypothetical protein